MTNDQLIEVARALRAFKWHPSRNTRAMWDAAAPEHREAWLKNARKLLDHLAASGLSICEARFSPKETENGK